MLKNSLIYIGGEIFSKIVPFLFLPYLTRTLEVDGYGQLAYYLAIIQLAGVFVGFSSHSAVSRYYFRYGNRSVSIVVTAAIIFGCLSALLFALFAVFLGEPLGWLLAASALANSVLACGLSLLQCQRRALLYVLLQLLNAVVSVLLTVLLFELLGYAVVLRLYSILAGVVVTVGLIGIASRLRFKFWSLSKLWIVYRYLFAFGLPMMIHTGCNFIRFEFDKIALKGIFSLGELGIYALAAKIGALVQLALFAINKAAQPAIYEGLKKGQVLNRLAKFNIPVWIFCFVCPLAFVLVPEFLILQVFGKEFVGIKSMATVFVFGYALLAPYFLYSNVAFYYGWTRLLSFSAALSMVTYFIVFYMTIYMENLEMVPWALAASSFCLAVVMVVGVQLKLKITMAGVK